MEPSESLICELVETADIREAILSKAELSIADAMQSPKRRTEFQLGRIAAQRALKQLHDGPVPEVLRGKDGEPLWPEGIVGSISHTDGAAVAVAGYREEFEGLGVDLELTSRAISPGVVKKIALPAEKVWIAEQPRLSQARTLQLFCAKESIYKAYFPICRKRMSFDDAFVRWEAEHEAFIGTLLVDLDDDHRAGDLSLIHCSVTDKYTLCCTILSAAEVPNTTLNIL